MPSAGSVSQTVRHLTYAGDGMGSAAPKELLGDTSYALRSVHQALG